MATYSYYRERINWFGLFDEYALNLLYALGMDSYTLDEEIRANKRNPLVEKLRSDPSGFIHACRVAGNGQENMDGTARAVSLCQMMVYDQVNGPEQDGKEKALRRHWYVYFKQFSQMFAKAIDPNVDFDDPRFNLGWSGRLSKVYASFVDGGEVTYKNLWVEDASRMMEVFGTYDTLFPGFQLIIAVEKDSLFKDFVQAARAMGAMAIISGKGKNSKAAAELMIRKLGWTKDENPLDNYQTFVVHLSDHDFDGQGVIGPTFGEQLRRYLNNIVEERVGVRPDQVQAAEDGEYLVAENVWDASYQVKVSNKGYRSWADENALFWAECTACHHEQYVIGVDEGGFATNHNQVCDSCGQWTLEALDYEQPHGFEVEALRSQDYYRAMVDAVLAHINWGDIVYQMRLGARPDPWEVTNLVKEDHLSDIPRYQKISNAIDTLREAQYQLERSFEEALQYYIEDAISNTQDSWVAIGDDPEVDEFREYVVSQARSGYGSVWRPFPKTERNRIVAQHLERIEELATQLRGLDIEDFDDIVDSVTSELQD